MKDRILEFLRNENKSSAQLADDIGVQASGISHILSGRNNPSLDFIMKMLNKYPFISTDWLLFGKGSMYKEPKMQNLFEQSYSESSNIPFKESYTQESQNVITGQKSVSVAKMPSSIVKIIWFYENNTFEEFFPKNI